MQATAIAHPNIALIKYWGKQDVARNLPATGSLSLTLGDLITETHVEFDASLDTDAFTLDGAEHAAGAKRVSACLDELRGLAGISTPARVVSSNSFPTGAGLASSASGFSALVVAAAAALKLELPDDELVQIAGRGSGSAARSLYGGYVLLTKGADRIHCEALEHADAFPLSTLVAVVSKKAKSVGSTEGMERSRLTSPFYANWVDSHPADLDAGVDALRRHDFAALAELAEHNCLKMHSVAMTSRPPLFYWAGSTLECMRRVQEMRAAGTPVFFTIDAGPQLKAMCEPGHEEAVAAALAEVPGVVEVLRAGVGGPARLAA